ncbi:MAG: hypothetical protein VB049_11345 [Candidatus Pelethousia sp.]|nr:hypothetical protein [Candidatus Pelethousia sp.]
MFVVLFRLDRITPAMEFISKNTSKWLLSAFCLCAITNGIIGARYIFTMGKACKKENAGE